MNTEKKLLSPKVLAEIDHWVAKFPPDQKQSAVLPSLLFVQKNYEGWLSRELLDAVADYLGMPKIAVYEVATFYSMYDLKPVGRHKISVCTNISCVLAGTEKIADHLKKRLNINWGETTPDGKITLREVECLGACASAPMFQLDERYCENLTPEKVDEILDEIAGGLRVSTR